MADQWLPLLLIACACAVVSTGVRGYLHTIAERADGDESAAEFGRALLIGAALAVGCGAIIGWRLDAVDAWLGGVAGLVGACAPWADAMVKSLARKWVKESAPPGITGPPDGE